MKIKKLKEIAAEAGISTSHLCRVIHGKGKLKNVAVALRIEEASCGQVKAEELIPDLKDYFEEGKIKECLRNTEKRLRHKKP